MVVPEEKAANPMQEMKGQKPVPICLVGKSGDRFTRAPKTEGLKPLKVKEYELIRSNFSPESPNSWIHGSLKTPKHPEEAMYSDRCLCSPSIDLSMALPFCRNICAFYR